MEYKKEDPRIRLIRNKKNRGILYNRIYGGLQSRGEYVTFIDADDLYINPYILQLSYDDCIKNHLDILRFDYYGGMYDQEKKEFLDVFIFSNNDKSLYNKVLYQPEIKKGFFYDNKANDFLTGYIFNKIYSHKEIEKMADYIGEDFWTQHYIYMEDFIMSIAVARTAKSLKLLGFGGVFHWFNNPKGMTNGIFEMDGKKLKNPQDTNKKLGDYFSIWEKAFDLTENDPDSENFRLNLILMLKDRNRTDVIARTYQFERMINLCKRMYNWKYASDYGKNKAKEIALETIGFEVPIKEKYDEFFDDDEKYEVKKNKKSKKKKKKKNNKFEENEIEMKEKEEKKREKKKENKDNIFDGVFEGVKDL